MNKIKLTFRHPKVLWPITIAVMTINQSINDPMVILGTLLQQMIEKLPCGLAKLINIKDVNLVREMGSITDVIIDITTEFVYVYIILDALDECDEEGRSHLCPMLKKLGAHIPIMIICRDIDNFLGESWNIQFPAKDFRAEPWSIQIGAKDVQTDIVEFLQVTVHCKGDKGIPDILCVSKGLRKEIIDELSVGAEGR
jgi:hypothetical protein